ncbi:FG-GAP repeat protein, partial [Candidatus Sumerlaeota bacterium]|nr:FG-GAP repeat protein [Candidatus Sumerlaeota bacterium]
MADESSWFPEALESIREEEYAVTWQDNCLIPGGKAGFHIVNRKENLRLYFFPEGVKAISRMESKPTWILGWSIAGIGKREKQFLEKPQLRAERNLLEYNRGNILEQYENLKSGINAQIVIKDLPKGDDPLTVKIRLEGDVTFGFKTGASEIDFFKDEKAVAGFRNIRALDAAGKNIPIKTTLHDKELGISVENKDVAYPVQVNFLLVTPPPWSAESNKADAVFGVSVRTAGDVNADGYSDLIIGASTYDNGEIDEGRAFVYYGSVNGPSPISNWVYESNVVDAHLGISVSTAGDVNGDGYSDVIIGAKNYTNDQAAEGGALVFYGSSAGLGITFDLLEGNSIGSSFGCSVAFAGDVNKDEYSDVVVGAEFQYDDGKAYVFKGSAGGIVKTPFWDYTSYLEEARFGCSVCTAGDVNRDGYADIIIGSVIADNGQMGEGRAYVFHGGESDMTLGWHYESNMENWFLGKSVSTAGDVNGDGYSDVVIGVTGFDNGEIAEGGAFIFHGSSTGLGGSPNRIIEPNVAGIFGNSVSTAGDMDGDGYADIIVGAHYYSNEYTYEGAAYAYRGSKNGIGENYSWFQKGNQAFAEFGYSVSTAGDVNGDGYSDIIVGAPYYDNGETNEGKCFLYYGKPLPPSNVADWNTENAVANCEFASSVASAGDVNGDGYSDIMVGAYLFDNGHTNEGRVFIYHGRSNNVPLTTPEQILEVNSTNAYFGSSLASAGDVNNDGYDDIVIGAVGYSNFEGKAYMYLGSDTGIGTSPNWSKEPNLDGGHFGDSVAGAGDVNGDGYADIIIGMSSYPNGVANGRAYVYHGAPTGLTSTRTWDYICDQTGAFLGTSVAGAGDVNGDGYSDVIIGAPGYDNGQVGEGGAYVFHGSHNGVNLNPAWMSESNQASAVYGQSVSSAGDVNGDGYSDVIVGAPYYNGETDNEGAAFIHPGGANGLIQGALAILHSANQENARFGYSVAGAGDVNGDGFSDALV